MDSIVDNFLELFTLEQILEMNDLSPQQVLLLLIEEGLIDTTLFEFEDYDGIVEQDS